MTNLRNLYERKKKMLQKNQIHKSSFNGFMKYFFNNLKKFFLSVYGLSNFFKISQKNLFA